MGGSAAQKLETEPLLLLSSVELSTNQTGGGQLSLVFSSGHPFSLGSYHGYYIL